MKQILINAIIAFLLGGTGWAVVRYFVDRRDKKPERQVAQQTVSAQVEATGLANLERRLAAMERVHDQEIESLQSTIDNLRRRVVELEKNAGQLRLAVSYIRTLRQWIDKSITDATVHPPAVPAGLELDD